MSKLASTNGSVSTSSMPAEGNNSNTQTSSSSSENGQQAGSTTAASTTQSTTTQPAASITPLAAATLATAPTPISCTTTTTTTRLLSQSRQESVGELFYSEEDRVDASVGGLGGGSGLTPPPTSDVPMCPSVESAATKGTKRSMSPLRESSPAGMDALMPVKRLKETHVSYFV